MTELPTEEEIAKLPGSSIAVFASRCAQRVTPLYRLPEDHPELASHIRAVRSAAFPVLQWQTYGDSRKASEAASIAAALHDSAHYVAASYAANAAHYASDTATTHDGIATAAYNAATAATTAADLEDSEAIMRRLVKRDFEKLRQLGHLMQTMTTDSIERMGTLWPDGEPDWFIEGKEWQNNVLKKAAAAEIGDSYVELEFSIPEGMSDDELAEFVRQTAVRADQLQRDMGGHGLIVDDLQIHADVLVTEGQPGG